MRVHLPLLLALSANSPFWLGATAASPRPGRRSSGAFRGPGSRAHSTSYDDYVDTLADPDRRGAVPGADLRLVGPAPAPESTARSRSGSMDTQAEVVAHGGAGGADPVAGAAWRRSRRRPRRAGATLPSCWRRTASAPRATASGRSCSTPRALRVHAVEALAELAVEACRPHARELGCERELDAVTRPGRRARRRAAARARWARRRPRPVVGGAQRALQPSAARSRRSTARAQRRPSAIAVTISDWPTRASPAA